MSLKATPPCRGKSLEGLAVGAEQPPVVSLRHISPKWRRAESHPQAISIAWLFGGSLEFAALGRRRNNNSFAFGYIQYGASRCSASQW